jgi:hypothetical protein
VNDLVDKSPKRLAVNAKFFAIAQRTETRLIGNKSVFDAIVSARHTSIADVHVALPVRRFVVDTQAMIVRL